MEITSSCSYCIYKFWTYTMQTVTYLSVWRTDQLLRLTLTCLCTECQVQEYQMQTMVCPISQKMALYVKAGDLRFGRLYKEKFICLKKTSVKSHELVSRRMSVCPLVLDSTSWRSTPPAVSTMTYMKLMKIRGGQFFHSFFKVQNDLIQKTYTSLNEWQWVSVNEWIWMTVSVCLKIIFLLLALH